MSQDAIREDWHKRSESFEELMSTYAQEYQWNQEPGQKLNKGTKAWDLVQSRLLCCGLKGPKDWPQKWKPSQKNILPKSCCIKLSRAINSPTYADDKCDLEHAFKQGCIERIDYIVESSSKYTLIDAIANLILACMALILASQRDNNQLSCAATNTTPQYQRFDQSVYVRQPGAHQVSFGKQPPVAPSLYPSVHGAEQHEAPPKYGSGT